MQMSFIIPAGDDTVFAKDAFVNTVGQPVIVNGQPGVIHKAVVDDNGKSVEFTVVIDALVMGDYDGDPADY